MNRQSVPNTPARVTLLNMSDETPGQEVRRRRGVLTGPRGRELTQQQLADYAGVSVETIGNIEKDASDKAPTLPLVRAALARLEAEQGIGTRDDILVIPPLLKATLAVGTPDVIRTRQHAGIIEVFMLVRPADMSEEEFSKRVADFDAGRV